MLGPFGDLASALRTFAGRSLRRRLLIAVSLVNAVLMGLFTYGLIDRQSDFLRAEAQEQAANLAEILAANSVSWTLANDVSGLGELVAAMAKSRDLDFIMVLDPAGRVMAHSSASHVGQYVVDEVSQALLASEPGPRLLVKTETALDVAAPVLSGGKLAGWARVRLNLADRNAVLTGITRSAVLFGAMAVVVGGLAALWTAMRLSDGLSRLLAVSAKVGAGARDVRADDSRDDEIGRLARGFNTMLGHVEATERSLQASLKWKMTILENNAAGILVVSGNRVVAEVNRRFCVMLGYRPDEVLGQSARMLHADQEGFDAFGKSVAQAPRAGAPFTDEIRLRRKDGSTFWCEISGSVLDPAEPSQGWAWILIDVTERKAKEQALAESEEKFRTVAGYTFDWEYWVGHDGAMVYCSPSCERITGYPEASFMADKHLLARLIHPEDRAAYASHLQHVLDPEDREPYTEEFRLVSAGGAVRVVSHSCVPVYRADGAWWGRRACNRDVTEQHESRKRLQSINACFLGFGADPERNISELAAVCGQLLGAASAHYLRDEDGLVHAGHWLGPQARLDEEQAAGRYPNHLEQTARAALDDAEGAGLAEEASPAAAAPSGEFLHVCQPVTWAGGAAGALCLRFVGGRRLDESERRFLGLVSMAIGVEEQRRQSQAVITAALEEKNILIKEIHHRVKNNMQVISSLLSLQSGYIEDPSAHELFVECVARIQAMSLIHEELYKSQDLAHVDFARYVKRLAGKLMASLAMRPGLDVRFELEHVHLPVDKCIPCGLVINELVTNALKHAFPDLRHGVVTLKLSRRDAGVQVCVEDDGVGLPENLNIQDAATLGLQLVTGLVDQLGGTLQAGGGRGACFCIWFPLEARPHGAAARSSLPLA